MIVICDDREPISMDAVALAVGGIEFERKRLKTGDYVWEDIVIERKQIDDFAASIIDGRLDGQIKKMKDKFTKIYILVSGHLEDKTSAIHENCILGKMASILVKHNVSILMMDNDFQLVYVMKKIFEKHQTLKTISSN